MPVNQDFLDSLGASAKNRDKRTTIPDLWARAESLTLFMWIPYVRAIAIKDWEQWDKLYRGNNFITACGLASLAADLKLRKRGEDNG